MPDPNTPQPALAYETPKPQWDSVTIGVIALKILGIYCLTLAMPLVGFFFSAPEFWSAPRFNWSAAGSVLYYVMYLAMGVVLIWFAPRLGELLFGRRHDATSDDESAALRMPPGSYLQAIAFSVIGVWMCAEAIPRVVYWVVRVRGSSSIDIWPTAAQSLAQAAVGAALFLRAPGLALLWHKIRRSETIPDDNRDSGSAS